MEKKPYSFLTRKQKLILILLLVFCLPAGFLYLLWRSAGWKALLIGGGCMMLPLLLVLLWIGLAAYGNSHPDTGAHLPRVDWLPEEASDISFYRSYSNTAYEFKISERDFLRGANRNWKFQEIEEPVSVPRYLYFLALKNHKDYGSWEEMKKGCFVTISEGVFSEVRRKNGGGHIAVYDRKTGYAYVHTNPR